MCDDFEKAVLFSFDHCGGVGDELKRQAQALLHSVEASPDAWQLCLARLESSSYAEVKFWCLQTLNALVCSPAYAALPPSARDQVKRSLVATGMQPPPAQLPPFLRNKLAQAVVAIAAREYPDQWPAFFQDLLRTLGQGPAAVDLFCRVLVAVDEDIITLDVPRSAEEAKQSMRFKDSMRERALADLADAWSRVVGAYCQSAPGTAAFVLETVQRYVHWIDISLVANDTFVPLLFAVLNSQHEGLRGAAADVLTEIVTKRMEAIPKLTLIQTLGVVPVCALWSAGLPGVEEEHELAVKYAKLLAALATELLESWKKVENSVLSLAAVGLAVGDDATAEAGAACVSAAHLLEALFPAVLTALRTGDDEVVAAVAPFLVAHVARLRTLQKRGGGALPPGAAAQLLPIQEAAAASARFADDSSAYESTAASAVERIAAAEEEAVGEHRQELFTLFRNVAKLAPAESYLFVGRRLEAVLSRPDAPWQDVELALNLLYQLGEGAPEEALKPGTGALAALAAAVMQADVPAARHRLVALALLETCARYARLLQQQQALAPLVVGRCLGGTGLSHPSEAVQRRAAYLFCRIVKTLRSQIKALTPDILTRLQPQLAAIAATPLQEQGRAAGATGVKGPLGGPASAADDRLYAFEAAGLVLGLEDLPEAEQLGWLAALLEPLVAQLESNLQLAAPERAADAAAAMAAGSPPPAALIQQSLEAMTRFSKGFSVRLCTEARPGVGSLLLGSLQAAVAVPRQLPAHKQLRIKYLAFLHRMIEVLGAAALPLLPSTLQALTHTGADATDLADVLALLNQLMLRFKQQLAPLVHGVLPVCVSRVHALLPADWDWSGASARPPAASPAPGGAASGAAAGAVAASASDGAAAAAAAGSTEDLRERGELQRAYYAFLHSLVHAELAAALLHAPHGTLDASLGALMRGAATHVNPAARKTCIQTIGKMATEWLGGSGAKAGATAPTSPRVAAPLGSPGSGGGGGCDQGLPGFRDFVAQRFGGEVLLESLVSPSGGVDIRDAAAISLLTEVAAQLKSVRELCGDAFLSHVCAVALPRMGWPAAAREQLAQHIAASDVKQLKEFLKAALVELRQQQNGGQAGRTSR